MASNSKKAKYMCHYTSELSKSYSFVQPCRTSVNKFRCTVCNKDLSLASGGKKDITKHANSQVHKANEKAIRGKYVLHTQIIYI